MNKETLQKLVVAHNTLYNVTVTGNAIIPVANTLTLLQSVIGPEITKMNTEKPEESGHEVEASEQC